MKKIIHSIMAGLYIAFGAMASQYATALTSNKLVGALLFPIGLSMVVVTGSELFTGKCLIIMDIMGRKKKASDACGILGRIYVGNFIGSLIAAAAGYAAGIGGNIDVVTAAAGKCSQTPSEILVKAILCNILVCTAVYMSQQESSAAKKIIAVYLPVVVFVLCGFEHSVADMYFLPVAYMTDPTALTIAGIFKTIVLATVGNIIGGFATGSCFYKIKN